MLKESLYLIKFIYENKIVKNIRLSYSKSIKKGRMIQIKQEDFEDLKDLLKRNNVNDEDISELEKIMNEEKPDIENNKFGTKTNGWISKMVNKCLDGSWAIGIGAAGKLLADGIKAYYGWPI